MNKTSSAVSKVFGLIDSLACLIGLNLLFLVCCIPLITVGASLTSLYAGLRALIKKQPCFRAFFKTFGSGFVRITLAWVLMALVTAPVVFNAATLLYYQVDGFLPALVLSVLICLVLVSIATMAFLFYSRFECTLLQLFKYAGTLAVSYPVRSLCIAALTWLPVVLIFLAPSVFLLLGLVWLLGYFAAVSVAAIWLMNLPFASFAYKTLGMDAPKQSPSSDTDR